MKEILGKALTYDEANEQSSFFAPNYPRTTELGVDLVVTYLQMEIWHYASEANHDELIQNVKDLFFFTCLKNEFPHVYDEVSEIIIQARGQMERDTRLEAYADTISGVEGKNIADFPASCEAQRNGSTYTNYKRYLTARLSIYKSKLENPFQELRQTRSYIFRIISHTYRAHPYLTFEEKKDIVELLLEDRQKTFDILKAASKVLHYDASNSHYILDIIIDFMIDVYVHAFDDIKVTLSDVEKIMTLHENDIHLDKIDSLNKESFMKTLSSFLNEVDNGTQKKLVGLLLVWKNYLPKETLLIGFAKKLQTIKSAKYEICPGMDRESVLRNLDQKKAQLDTAFLPILRNEYFSGKKLWSEEERSAIIEEVDLLDLFPQPHSDVDKMNIFLTLCDYHLSRYCLIARLRAYSYNPRIYPKLLQYTVSFGTDIHVNIPDKDKSKADEYIRIVYNSAISMMRKILLEDVKTYVLLLISACKLERICLANEKYFTEDGKTCRNVEEINRRMTKKNPLGWDIPWQENVDIDEWVSKYDEYIRSMQKTSGA